MYLTNVRLSENKQRRPLIPRGQGWSLQRLLNRQMATSNFGVLTVIIEQQAYSCAPWLLPNSHCWFARSREIICKRICNRYLRAYTYDVDNPGEAFIFLRWSNWGGGCTVRGGCHNTSLQIPVIQYTYPPGYNISVRGYTAQLRELWGSLPRIRVSKSIINHPSEQLIIATRCTPKGYVGELTSVTPLIIPRQIDEMKQILLRTSPHMEVRRISCLEFRVCSPSQSQHGAVSTGLRYEESSVSSPKIDELWNLEDHILTGLCTVEQM